MRRIVLTVALGALLIAVAAPTVAARDMFFSRSNGFAVQTQWIQLDRDAGGNRLPPMESRPFGNVHIGFLFAQQSSRGQAFAFGEIADLNCPVDYVPPFGGGHGGFEEPENPCTHIGLRSAQGENLPFQVDRKLTSARLGGPGVTIGIFGGGDPHGGGGEFIANVPLNVVWTGVGVVATSKGRQTYNDGTSTWTEAWNVRSRNATMGGVLGPMGFDPALSSGSIEEYSNVSRSRSR